MTKYLSLLLALSFSLHTMGAESLSSFELPIYKEKTTYSYQLPHKKKVLINFWATWCTSCIQEIPILEKLKKQNPDVEFLAVNAGDSPRKIKKFLKKHGFSYKVLMDRNKEFSKGLGILSLPQTLVVDKDGKVIYHKEVPPTQL